MTTLDTRNGHPAYIREEKPVFHTEARSERQRLGRELRTLRWTMKYEGYTPELRARENDVHAAYVLEVQREDYELRATMSDFYSSIEKARREQAVLGFGVWVSSSQAERDRLMEEKAKSKPYVDTSTPKPERIGVGRQLGRTLRALGNYVRAAFKHYGSYLNSFPCARCHGTGRLQSGVRCPSCRGTGSRIERIR